MKLIGRLLSSIILLFLLLIFILAFLGFVPVLSNLFGSDKPKDLKVTTTQADFNSISLKNQIKIINLPNSTTIENSILDQGSHPVKQSFTQEELTAAANGYSWAYFPFRSIQIKINPDNTIEASGKIIVSRVVPYAIALGASREQVEKGLSFLNIPAADFSFYAKANGRIENNKLTGSFSQIQLGRLDLPSQVVSTINSKIIEAVNHKLSGNPSISIKSASLGDGQAHYEGTLPDTESVLK